MRVSPSLYRAAVRNGRALSSSTSLMVQAGAAGKHGHGAGAGAGNGAAAWAARWMGSAAVAALTMASVGAALTVDSPVLTAERSAGWLWPNLVAYAEAEHAPVAAAAAAVAASAPLPPLPAGFVSELETLLREDQIEQDLRELENRGKPWNSYHKIKEFPSIIVFPESTQEVSGIVRLCHRYEVPIVPFGGGTSLEGQTLATRRGLSLDFNRMKRVLQLNEQDLDITVQAGIGYVELNDILRSKGLWFPLDPGPGASIGGMAACRCSGSTAVRYGSMRENVLNLTAVLSDGTIIKTGSRARKSSAGYDLTRLLIGSEGTLAVITEATLKLHGIPKFAYALKVSFPGGVRDAALTAKETLNCGITLGRCELLDDTMVKIVNQTGATAGHAWPEVDTLLFEITGISREAVLEQVVRIQSLAAKHGGTDFVLADNPHECQKMWKIRKECLWAAMSLYPECEPLITDVCVPLSNLPELIAQTRRDIEASFLPCPIVAHAGDGNFHVIIMFKPNDPRQREEAKRLANLMAERAIQLEGTCTGEHGVGVGKVEFLAKEMGPGSMRVMDDLKAMMDPKNILNPGKVLPSQQRHFCH